MVHNHVAIRIVAINVVWVISLIPLSTVAKLTFKVVHVTAWDKSQLIRGEANMPA